ncbi:hypothetical protein LCGC14_1360710 [marine sediment metagenome]|uniref:Uncharacterized protein n=1 Tax=marine sediment metagenome TaxID=412755 RepID=A0A0F9K8T9_9ZZZZ
MPFHKKVFKKAGGLVKKINPFGKIARALKPKKKPARRPTTSTPLRTKPKKRMNKQLPSGVRVRSGNAPTASRRPLKVRPKAKRLTAQPFGRKKVVKKVGPRARRRPHRL